MKQDLNWSTFGFFVNIVVFYIKLFFYIAGHFTISTIPNKWQKCSHTISSTVYQKTQNNIIMKQHIYIAIYITLTFIYTIAFITELPCSGGTAVVVWPGFIFRIHFSTPLLICI